MAKLFASEMECEYCEEAIQIHGGYGYTKDYAPERILARFQVVPYWRRHVEIQRIVIARVK